MSAAAEAAPPPEFSRPLRADVLAGDHTVREIEASPAECRALAARFRIEAVANFRATVRLTRLRGTKAGMVQVKGTLSADVVQSCIVTLEPVPAHLEESFAALFAPEAPEADDDMIFDPFAEDDDFPEAMDHGIIDIGELAAQHLSLALDPYPRAPGAEFAGVDDDGPGDEGREAAVEEAAPINPFGALAALKRRP